MRWLDHRIPPPLVGLATALLMWALGRLTPFLHYPFSGHAFIGVAIGLAGLFVNIAGVIEFRKARTTVNPLRPDAATALVRTGIFKHTRNPMYLGLLLMVSGFAVYLSNPVSVLGLPCFVAYMNRFQIRSEETALQTLFGSEFSEYQSTVRRWL